MGWCSGTEVFDSVAETLLSDKPVDKKRVLKELIRTLEYMDWDCQGDSEYWSHPLVREIFLELHRDWFEEEDE